jgi:hypothetical protein
MLALFVCPVVFYDWPWNSRFLCGQLFQETTNEKGRSLGVCRAVFAVEVGNPHILTGELVAQVVHN